MAGRPKCTISGGQVQVLLKEYVEKFTDDYLNEDEDYIVKCYNSLLVALAEKSVIVKKKLIEQAAQEVFGVNSLRARRFGDAICFALSSCYQKSKRITSGKYQANTRVRLFWLW